MRDVMVIDLSSSPSARNKELGLRSSPFMRNTEPIEITDFRRRAGCHPSTQVIPDVDPPHVDGLVREQFLLTPDNVLEPVLHTLFENPSYPKVDRKGKRKRIEEGDNTRTKPKPKIDYATTDRPFKGGPHYSQLAIDQLMLDFPLIPKPHLRQVLLRHHSLYAPTHIYLRQESLRASELPYTLKTIPSRPAKKGKQKALHDDEFSKEKEWVDSWTLSEVTPEDVEEKCDDGLECGCCFSGYVFEKMIQCPEGHLFCEPCMTQYAETLLGSHDHKIVCMDQSGCKLAFPVEQLRRFLTPKLLDLYERVKQNKEVAAAGIQGLEECPFCEFKCLIENEQVGPTHPPVKNYSVCRNEECSSVTCRKCKQLDHLPKSCKEVEEDKKREGRHHVEEAMTRALMRNCPKCQKSFVKDHGCNKMICPDCHTMSCYVCREVITGYEHFATQPGQPNLPGSSKSNRCPLWDVAVEQRHVKAAAEKAREEYKRANPDADDEHLQVDLPVAPPPPPPPQQHPHLMAANAHHNAYLVNLQNANAYVANMQQMVHQAAMHLPPPVPQPVQRRARAPKRQRWR
ncbi:hypothetical protein C8F01DRAFT_1132808 [Mycena amicta]|nr:hypothetical protein C8F01DRAFT_1132808 [Mycena amicta]